MTEAELSFPPAARARMQLPINAMCSVNSVRHPRVAAPHEQDKQGGLFFLWAWPTSGGLTGDCAISPGRQRETESTAAIRFVT